MKRASIFFLLGFVLLQSARASESYSSFATVGGEWNFLKNDGAPFFGKDWQEGRIGFGIVKPKQHSFYFQYRLAGRSDIFDHVLSLEGQYMDLRPITFRWVFAGSPDHDFTYRFHSELEGEWQIQQWAPGFGYAYSSFTSTDIHLFSPYLRYSMPHVEWTFKYMNIYDSQAAQDYHAGSIRADFPTEISFLNPFVGFVGGERLIGALSPQSSPGQKGLIAFLGNHFHLPNGWIWTASLIYVQEEAILHSVGITSDVKVSF